MKLWRVIPVFALVFASCATQTELGTTTTTKLIPVTTAPATTIPLVAGCPEDDEFTEGGHVDTIEQTSSDANTIGLITWQAEVACETFTVSFETSEGAPATTAPSVSVDYVDELPIIRMSLDTKKTVITDQLVETPMVDRLYVVTSLDGGMYIDLHLAVPAQARVTVDSSPARLILDIQPGIVDYPTYATSSEFVVLATPVNDSTTVSPTSIEGYARTFESNVLLIATDGDEVVAEGFTTAADSALTWGEFRAEMVLPEGKLSLFVGDENQEEGGLEGVTINLTVQ